MLIVTGSKVRTFSAFAVGAVMLCWLLFRMYIAQSQDLAKIVGDRFARVIAPYAYSDHELESVISSKASRGSKLAKGMRAEEIRNRIDRLVRDPGEYSGMK